MAKEVAIGHGVWLGMGVGEGSKVGVGRGRRVRRGRTVGVFVLSDKVALGAATVTSAGCSNSTVFGGKSERGTFTQLTRHIPSKTSQIGFMDPSAHGN